MRHLFPTITVLLVFVSSLVSAEDIDLNLMNAAYCGDVQAVQRALERGANVNARIQDGRTPLGLAAEYGSPQVCRILLEAGADANAKFDGLQDQTALMRAAIYDNSEAIRVLLNAGAEVNSRSSEGDSALLLAAANASLASAVLLLDAGADPSFEDKANGWTASRWAEESNHAEIVDLIAGKGRPDESGEVGAKQAYLDWFKGLCTFNGKRVYNRFTEKWREKLQEDAEKDKDRDVFTYAHLFAMHLTYGEYVESFHDVSVRCIVNVANVTEDESGKPLEVQFFNGTGDLVMMLREDGQWRLSVYLSTK